MEITKEEATALLEWLKREYVPHNESYRTLVNFMRRLFDFVGEIEDEQGTT